LEAEIRRESGVMEGDLEKWGKRLEKE